MTRLYSIALFFTLFISSVQAQKTIYVNVNASGANNGNSWTSAYTDLQSALTTANSGDQIWVAAGVYKATSDTTRKASFNLKGGISLYGGFSGNETLVSKRNWLTNPTYLSGDIGTQGDSLDNTKTILICKNTSSASFLDGFTIEKGYNNSHYEDSSAGAGINLSHASLVINHCTFRNNVAAYLPGGAIFSDTSSILTVKNTSFINNNAELGASIYQQYKCSVNVDSSKFLNNYSLDAGTGIASYGSCTVVVSNSQFNNNTMGDEGVIQADGYCDLTITNCSFDSNSSSQGTAITFYASNSPITITNCSFTNNSASNMGGALYLFASANISNCQFKNNFGYSAGAIVCYNNAAFKNCQFISNTFSDEGGGIYTGDSLVVVDSCTFTGNQGTNNDITSGGGILAIGPLQLTNSWFTNNYTTNGGALMITQGISTIDNCTFDGNKGDKVTNGYGGVIDAAGNSGKLTITNSSFTGSRATDGGVLDLGIPTYISNCTFSNDTGSFGAVINGGDTLVITNSKFINNSGVKWFTFQSEGGVLYTSGYFKISNSLFQNNSADVGGVIYCSYDTAHSYIINCSFSGNKSDSGAIYNAAPLIIINSILWNDVVPEVFNPQGHVANVTYSLVEGGYTGIGNISTDPQWDSNLFLNSGSPAINAGKPDTTGLFIPAKDLAGSPRVTGGTIDLGAYEYAGAPTAVIKNQQSSSVVTAYPNPFSEAVYLVINRTLVSGNQLILNLSDINGKLVNSEVIHLSAFGATTYKLERGSLLAGIYLYKIESENSTVSTGKLVVVD